MIPVIEIRGTQVWINGTKARRKHLPFWAHCRHIYYDKDYVVKLVKKGGECDRYVEGQNEQEYQLWNHKITEEDKPYFVPIICYEKQQYIVQENITFMDMVGASTKDRKLITRLAKKYGLTDVMGKSNANWGIDINGNPRIYDYGV